MGNNVLDKKKLSVQKEVLKKKIYEPKKNKGDFEIRNNEELKNLNQNIA